MNTLDPDLLFSCHIKVQRHSSKKNEKMPFKNKRTGQFFIGKSAKAKSCENWLLSQLRIQKLKQRIETIDCDISIKMLFYFPESVFFTKKLERSKKLPDLSNLYELPQDCLQKVGIISNDTNVCSHDGSRRLPTDKPEYYLSIEIRKINGN